MERELTVKVNYVLGNQSAFTDAATQAEVVNQKVKQGATGVQSWLDKAKSAIGLGQGGVLSRAGGMLQAAGGIGGAGGGALGSALGISGLLYGGGMLAQDAIGLFGGGGGPMRGHGFIGMADSLYGWMSGRGLRERRQDMKLSEGDFIAGQVGARLASERERFEIARQARTPITEVDPYRRAEMERRRMAMDAGQNTLNLHKQEQEYRRDLAKMREGNILAMKAGKTVDWMNEERLRQTYMQNREESLRKMYAISGDRMAFEAQQLEQKKGTLREGQMAWGTMGVDERASVIMSAERLKKPGETLMPEEISRLNQMGIFRQAVQDYQLRKGAEGGYDELTRLAGDKEFATAGERAISKRSRGIKTTLEEELPTKELFDAMERHRKAVADMLDGMTDQVTKDRLNADRKRREFENQKIFIGERE